MWGRVSERRLADAGTWQSLSGDAMIGSRLTSIAPLVAVRLMQQLQDAVAMQLPVSPLHLAASVGRVQGFVRNRQTMGFRNGVSARRMRASVRVHKGSSG